MSGQFEVEAKFAIPDEQTFRRLLSAEILAGFKLDPASAVQLHDLYWDTDDRAIFTHGYACRLRRQSGRYLVTLKGLGDAASGVHRRVELEVELSEPLGPRDWPASAARELALSLCGDEPLRPLFYLDQVRHSRLAYDGDRAVTEVSLDHWSVARGEILSGTYLELEAELLAEGTEQELRHLAAVLQEKWNLVPVSQSKFDRALALMGTSTTPAEEVRGEMEPHLTAEERAILERLATKQKVVARRARLLLDWDAGLPRAKLAALSGLSPRRVRHWLHMFRKHRLSVFPSRVLSTLLPGEAETMPSETAEASAPGLREAAAEQAAAETAAMVAVEAIPPEESAPAAASAIHVEGAKPATRRVEVQKEPGIKADDPMAEAGRKTLRFHYRRMLDNEEGTRDGVDIEALHDMRVATRRMRAALRVFGEYFDAKAVAPHLKGLRRTGQHLGAVRDLDVFREKVLAYRQTLPSGQQGGLDGFLGELERQRDSARERLITYLDSDGYHRFVERFDTFVETPGMGSLPMAPGDGAPRPNRVCHVAPMAIYERLAEVLAYDAYVTLPDQPLSRLHALRIATKRLRYTLEFFQDVLGPETRSLVRDTVAVQDHLGLIQDGVVASGILRDYLVWGMWGPEVQGKRLHDDVLPVIAPGVVIYLAARQVEIQQLVAEFPALWRRIANQSFSRRVATAVGAL